MLTDLVDQNCSLQSVQAGRRARGIAGRAAFSMHSRQSGCHDCGKLDCLPHFFEDKFSLEGFALPLGAPDAHDQGHLDLACKTALLRHVVFCYVELQCITCMNHRTFGAV